VAAVEVLSTVMVVLEVLVFLRDPHELVVMVAEVEAF
jgi:hypothetical protein